MKAELVELSDMNTVSIKICAELAEHASRHTSLPFCTPRSRRPSFPMSPHHHHHNNFVASISAQWVVPPSTNRRLRISTCQDNRTTAGEGGVTNQEAPLINPLRRQRLLGKARPLQRTTQECHPIRDYQHPPCIPSRQGMRRFWPECQIRNVALPSCCGQLKSSCTKTSLCTTGQANTRSCCSG